MYYQVGNKCLEQSQAENVYFIFRIHFEKGSQMMDYYFYLGLAVPVLIGAILFKD